MINNNKTPLKMLCVKPAAPLDSLKQNKIATFPNTKLYINKGQLSHYFSSVKALPEPESCEKLHKESNDDFESSSATTPTLRSKQRSKRTIATNTETVRGTLFKASGNMECLQPQLGSANYFMFPVYGIREQSIQTEIDKGVTDSVASIKDVSGKSMVHSCTINRKEMRRS